MNDDIDIENIAHDKLYMEYNTILSRIGHTESLINRYEKYMYLIPIFFSTYALAAIYAMVFIKKQPISTSNIFIIIFLIILHDIIVFFYFRAIKRRREKILDRLLKEKDDLKHEIDQKPTSPIDYFNTLVNVNLKNLGDYYELVKESNAKSFWTSLIVTVIGITFISAGIILGFSGDSSYKDIAYISSGSGIFIELVTALLFYLYNKTVIQLKEYHSSLLDVQNILLSFKLINDIKDDHIKTELIKEILPVIVKNNH